jgi:cytochrome c oxidase assembly factor CtaG
MMTYYQRNRARQLELARKYRAANRVEINRKQRERYATNADYRQYQADYHEEYRRLFGG